MRCFLRIFAAKYAAFFWQIMPQEYKNFIIHQQKKKEDVYTRKKQLD